jgi:predicted RNA-binding Zn ribbon-like protein
MTSLELIRDFVNTADLEDDEDKLATTRGLQYWLVLHGLAQLRDRATESELAEAVRLREALRALLRAHTGVEVDTTAAAETLNEVAKAVAFRLRFSGPTIRFDSPLKGIAGGIGRVLAAVAETMADGSWQRLKACRSDTCQWAFIDNARNGSRKWCDMAVCGNRAKARTFRRKHA